jgi:hypothetical protein
MTARFGKKEVVFVALGILGLLVYLLSHWSIFTTSSKDSMTAQNETVSIARQYLEAHGFSLTGYSSSVHFSKESDSIGYLQKTFGMEKSDDLAKKLPLKYWVVDFVKESQAEKFSVYVNPQGYVIAFLHHIPEEAAGADLKQDQALPLALAFLQRHADIDLSQYTLIKKWTIRREHRTDHTFVWEGTTQQLGEANLYMMVEVDGDVVNFYNRDFDTPEAFKSALKQEKAYGDLLVKTGGTLEQLLTFLAVIVFLGAYKKGDIPWKGALLLAVIMAGVSLVAGINGLPQLKAAAPSESPLYVFWTHTALDRMSTALWLGGRTFLFAVAGWALCRAVFTGKRHDGLTSYRDWFSSDIAYASLMGYVFAFMGLGYMTIFYFVGENYFGVWSQTSNNSSDGPSVLFPFLQTFTSSFHAAVVEELIYRFFAIALLMKYLRVPWLALLIPSMIWAFSHSPIDVPFYTRGIELTLEGFVYGYFFIRYGLIAVIVSHYVFDALLGGLSFWPMIIVVGVMGVPIVLVSLQKIRNGFIVLVGRISNFSKSMAE